MELNWELTQKDCILRWPKPSFLNITISYESLDVNLLAGPAAARSSVFNSTEIFRMDMFGF